MPQTAGDSLFGNTQPNGDGFNGIQQWQGGLTEFDTASLNIGSPYMPRSGQPNQVLSDGSVAQKPSLLEPLQVDTGTSKASKALQALAAARGPIALQEQAFSAEIGTAQMSPQLRPNERESANTSPTYPRGTSFTQNRL